MMGILFGTACLVGLVGVVKGGRRCHGGGGRFGRRGWHGHGPHGHGWHGERGHGGGGRGRFGGAGFSRAAAEMFKRRLHVDEDQEGIVDHAFNDLFSTLKEAATELRSDRSDIAKAFAAEEVDEAALAALFERQDERLARTRREVVSAFKQIHAVLDPEQRARAAEWLAAGDAGWV